MRTPLPSPSIRLPLLWAALISLPTLGGALAPLWSHHPTPSLDTAYTLTTYLTLLLLPLLWTLSSSPHRLAEAILLASVSLPPTLTAYAFSSTPPAHAATATALTLLTGALTALTLSTPHRSPTTLLTLSLWSAGLPLATWVALDLGLSPPTPLTYLSPALSLQHALHNDPLLPTLLAPCALPALLLLPRAHRALTPHRAPPALLALLLLLPTPAHAQSPRPLLGPYVRQGDPAPIELPPHTTPLGARSLHHTWTGSTTLLPTPLGGSLQLSIVQHDGNSWTPLDLHLPPPITLGPRDLLVGLLGDGARPLAAAWTHDRDAHTIILQPHDLPTLARAGSALDAIAIGHLPPQTSTHHLRAWIAAGGTALFAHTPDAAHTLGPPQDSSPHSSSPHLTWHALGNGLLGLPTPHTPTPTLARAARPELTHRTRTRARRLAIQDAILRAPPPLPSPHLAQRTALALLTTFLAWAALAFLARRAPSAHTLGAATLASTALSLWLLTSIAPRTPSYADSFDVWEAPNGARIATRWSWTRATSPRTTPTTLHWADPHPEPPRPVFEGSLQAAQTNATIHTPPGAPPSLQLELGRTRTWLRADAIPLPGTITVQNDTATSHGWTTPPDHAIWIQAGPRPNTATILELPPLTPNTPIPLNGTPQDFDRWRLDPAGNTRWRRRIAAALVGRNLQHTSLLIAHVPTPNSLARGIAEETNDGALLIVRVTSQ